MLAVIGLGLEPDFLGPLSHHPSSIVQHDNRPTTLMTLKGHVGGIKAPRIRAQILELDCLG